MALWILKKKDNLPESDNPWRWPYGKTIEAVVRARNEIKARQIMASKTKDDFRDKNWKETALQNPWKDEKYTTCEKLKAGGKSGIIVGYFVGD